MHVLDPLNDVFIQLGSLTWYRYSLMILIGIIIAAVLGIKEGNKLGIKTDDILDGILIIVPLSIVGTRLWYVIFEFGNIYLPKFQESFLTGLFAVINVSDGGLAIHGGFITAFVAAYFFTKRRGINILSTFDIMAPGFLIAQASGRWGNFFNQEAHGGMIGGVDGSDVPLLNLNEQRAFLTDKLHLPDFITNNMLIDVNGEGLQTVDALGDTVYAAYYHPTFLYESVWNVIGFIIMLVLRRTKWLKTGDLLAFYLVWYSTGRFFIEAMRTDSLYIGDTGIRTAQLISVLMILGGIAFFILTRKVFNAKKYHEVLDEVKEQNTNTSVEKGI